MARSKQQQDTGGKAGGRGGNPGPKRGNNGSNGGKKVAKGHYSDIRFAHTELWTKILDRVNDELDEDL